MKAKKLFLISGLLVALGFSSFAITLGVLDSFTRANANPLDGSWTNQATNKLQILSNQVAIVAADGNFTSGMYNASTYGPDCEVFVTVATKPSTPNYVYVDLRVRDFDTAGEDKYSLSVSVLAGTDEFSIYRFDNGSNTQLGAVFTQEITNGDSIGLSVTGSTLTAYYKSGAGSWTSLGTRTDATYNYAGNISMGTSSSVTRLDDFGGGTLSAGGGSVTSIMKRRRQ